MFKPLNGIKVIDLTSVLAGPYCTYQLSLLGAEVIKIENMLNGDWTRSGGMDNDLNSQSMGSTYLVQNSNKKSIQVDLKTKKGQNILYELIKSADVFVENMRPGKAEKLGLDWDHLSGLNESLIYYICFNQLAFLLGFGMPKRAKEMRLFHSFLFFLLQVSH